MKTGGRNEARRGGGATGRQGDCIITPSRRHPVAPLPRHPWLVVAAGLLVGLAGCSSMRSHVERKLMADGGPGPAEAALAERYAVGCADVLEVTVGGPNGLTARAAIGPDGRIDLGSLGRPRVEGRTTPAIARALAEQTGVPVEQVSVRVVEYHSQVVYLFGQVAGLQRSVPYHGPETVLQLLRRAGGITPGAEPDDVHVVRAHVGDGQRPEVFRVDLRAIVIDGDQRTNLHLLPFDQVHVGETRQAKVERCIPPCLRPLYQAVWDTRPEAGPGEPPWRGLRRLWLPFQGSGVRDQGSAESNQPRPPAPTLLP